MTPTPNHPAALALQGLIGLSNEIERELARVLGLNPTDYRALAALAALAASGPVTVGRLAGQLGVTPATATVIVNRLERHGYALRERADGDRRQVHVRVAPAGYQRIMALMGPLMAETNDHLWALPADDQRVVADFLEAAQGQLRRQVDALSTMMEP